MYPEKTLRGLQDEREEKARQERFRFLKDQLYSIKNSSKRDRPDYKGINEEIAKLPEPAKTQFKKYISIHSGQASDTEVKKWFRYLDNLQGKCAFCGSPARQEFGNGHYCSKEHWNEWSRIFRLVSDAYV